MREGFYKADYQGTSGMGVAVLTLDSGKVAGADTTGGTYRGTYEWNEQKQLLDANVTVSIPEGVQVVQGQIAPPGGLKFDVKCSFPREPDNEVVEAASEFGPLSIRLKWLLSY